MYKYTKMLQYPINIEKKDLKMAKCMLAQFGGGNSELGAALRYYTQKFTMPTEEGKNLLNSIATEELSHIEMIGTIIKGLMKDATKEELIAAGLDGNYAEHGMSLFPTSPNGVPFSTMYFSSMGDPIADLSEDMAAEQKARAVYEHLIDLTDDEDVIGPLLFLRQREIVHFERFKELYNKYKKMGY